MLRIGQKLRQRRQLMNLSIADVSKELKIKSVFLEAIEKGEYEKLPSSAYAYGFVRNYASFLGYPQKEAVALFRREFDTDKAFTVLPQGLSGSSEFPLRRLHVGEAFIFISALFILVLGYVFFQYRYAFINPPLEIISPKENDSFTTTEVVVSGKTDPNASVTINTASVSVDTEGSFSKRIDVFEGTTTIEVISQSRFGRKTTIDRHIIVKPSS